MPIDSILSILALYFIEGHSRWFLRCQCCSCLPGAGSSPPRTEACFLKVSLVGLVRRDMIPGFPGMKHPHICHQSLILFHVNCMTWPLCELFAIHVLPVPSPGPTHAMHELLFPVSSLDISGPIASLQQLWFPSAIKVCREWMQKLRVRLSISCVLRAVHSINCVSCAGGINARALASSQWPLEPAGRSCWKQRLINSYQIIPDFLTTSDIHTRPGLTSNQAVHLSYLVLEYVGIILDQCTVYIRISYLNIKTSVVLSRRIWAPKLTPSTKTLASCVSSSCWGEQASIQANMFAMLIMYPSQTSLRNGCLICTSSALHFCFDRCSVLMNELKKEES